VKSENIALFDLDGTLADFDEAMKRDLKKIAAPLEENIDPWNKTKPWIKERKNLVMRQPGWWKNLKPITNGFHILHDILNLDFEVHVLTKGPSTSSIAWAEKVEWCHKHLPPEVKITLTEDKGLVYGKVLVDDWPNYIERWLKWRPRGLVIMPDRPYNKDFEHPNVLRFIDYNDIMTFRMQMDIIRNSLRNVLKRESGQELKIL